MLQALHWRSIKMWQLTFAVRQLQASQAVSGVELVQTGTVVRRLQQQGTQSAGILMRVVCKGLGSCSLAMPSAASAVIAGRLRAGQSIAGRRYYVSSLVMPVCSWRCIKSSIVQHLGKADYMMQGIIRITEMQSYVSYIYICVCEATRSQRP